MFKTQKGFFFIFIVITAISYVLLAPRISSMLLPQKRSSIWKSFYEHTSHEQVINAREFWEFREFYSPGTITFEVKKLNSETSSLVLLNMHLSAIPNQYFHPFLYFKSEKIESLESLVSTNELNKILIFPQVPQKAQMVLNNTSSLFYISDKKATLVFIKPISEMSKANGYFNYKKDDRQLLKHKYWLVTTTIQLD